MPRTGRSRRGRLPGQRPPRAADRRRRPRGDRRLPPRHRKCWSKTGASSSPRTRSATSSSAPKARSTRAAATAPASTTPTTASSAGRSRTCAATRPGGRAGALAARAPKAARCAPRTCARRPIRRPWTGRSPHRSRHRRGAGPATRCPRSADANARRIVAFGFRNPFRFTIDPDGGEIYVGNVGWDAYEEIDRVPAVGALPALYNSGWPCYEGPGQNPIYAGLGPRTSAKSLYAEPGCDLAAVLLSTSTTSNGRPRRRVPERHGLGARRARLLSRAAPIPTAYDGALFFADPVRGCIWVMFPGEDGRPDPLSTDDRSWPDGGLYPGVDIEVGPEGDLYYVKLFGDDRGRARSTGSPTTRTRRSRA